jgi:hypothetical protein
MAVQPQSNTAFGRGWLRKLRPRKLLRMSIIDNARRRLSPLLTFGAAGVLAACSLATDTSTDQPPEIRVVNATTVSSVTVHLDGLELPIATVASNSATSGCLLVAPGPHVVSFLRDGQVLDEFSINYARNARYVVYLTNVGTTYRAFATSNEQSVPAGSNGLTLINATTAAGDVYITAASEDPSPATRVATALAPTATLADAPTFVVSPEANLRVRLFDVGTTTNPRADINLVELLQSRHGIVVFSDRVAGTDPGALQVDRCEDEG